MFWSQGKTMMRTKLTVCAILTVFIFAINAENHDWYQDQWHMDQWNNMGHIDPNHMGNMGSHDHNNQQNQNNNYGDNKDYDVSSYDPYFSETISVIYFICFILLAGINIFLCLKCLKKRELRKGIQKQMRMRRISFATLHGFDVQTLNDPRYSQTIHL